MKKEIIHFVILYSTKAMSCTQEFSYCWGSVSKPTTTDTSTSPLVASSVSLKWRTRKEETLDCCLSWLKTVRKPIPGEKEAASALCTVVHSSGEHQHRNDNLWPRDTEGPDTEEQGRWNTETHPHWRTPGNTKSNMVNPKLIKTVVYSKRWSSNAHVGEGLQ